MIAAIVLLINGVFAFLVWPTFYRRINADSRSRDAQGKATRFLRVHQILIGTALVLALLSLVVGVLALLGMTN